MYNALKCEHPAQHIKYVFTVVENQAKEANRIKYMCTKYIYFTEIRFRIHDRNKIMISFLSNLLCFFYIYLLCDRFFNQKIIYLLYEKIIKIF